MFKCNICGKNTRDKDGAADDMPDACSDCWAKQHALDIDNNPEWKPFIEAVKDCRSTPLRYFLDGYPPNLRPAVALALSLAKWYLLVSNDPFFAPGQVSCGCCALYNDHGDCQGCPLHTGLHFCVGGDTCEDIYGYILSIYTSHFNALPARDRQAK